MCLNFVLERIQFLPAFNFSRLIVHVVESGGCYKNKERGTSTGEAKIKKRGTKERIGKLMKSLLGARIQLSFCSLLYRIASKLNQDTAPCSKKMPDKAEISEIPSQKLLGVTFDRNMAYDSHVDAGADLW